MSDILLGQVSEISDIADVKLKAIAKRVVDTLCIAAEKAVANKSNPNDYPLPANADAAEHLFAKRLHAMPLGKQQAATVRLAPRINAPQQVREGLYKDLANINLKTASPVEQQISALAFPPALKFEQSHLNTIAGSPVLTSAAVAGLTSQQSLTKLELRIHRVKCVDETGDGWGGEWGSDEISLGGTAVSASGVASEVAPFHVKNFAHDGDVKTYEPLKRFALYNINDGGNSWPKMFLATLVLAEEDMGTGLVDFIEKLLGKIKDKLSQYLGAAIGAAVGGSLAGPIAAAVGAAVGWCLAKLWEWLKSWLGDDVFPPRTVNVKLASAGQRFAGNATDSPQGTVVFRGHDGQYEVTYDWALAAA